MTIQGWLSFLQITFSINITSLIPDLPPLVAINVLITPAFIRKMHFTFYHESEWIIFNFREDFFFQEVVFHVAIERDLMIHL